MAVYQNVTCSHHFIAEKLFSWHLNFFSFWIKQPSSKGGLAC
jgi:hypothetical protein